MKGTDIANWLLAHSDEPLTHLKLQKLCFYCYGVACALGGPDVTEVGFEAWQHGPVSTDLWRKYRYRGSEKLTLDDGVQPREFHPETERAFSLALRVYGRLNPSQIRNQSHLEAPWVDARGQNSARIIDEAIADHFASICGVGDAPVLPPAYLFGGGSFALDGIPGPSFDSFEELADFLDS